jgi:hypothetical protein
VVQHSNSKPDLQETLKSSNSGISKQAPSLKRQIITLDRFQSNENENNFGQISAGLMEIMYEMLVYAPDSVVNEILGLLKLESFIMFAMVNKAINFKARV